MKLFKLLLAIIIVAIIAGCSPIPPLPPPAPPEPTEIPIELLSFPSLDWFASWLRNNYHWTSDKVTTDGNYSNYYFTPAEIVMPVVRLVNGEIVEKIPLQDDCDGWSTLTAFILWKNFGYEAYVVSVSNGKVAHMLSYGYGPNGEFVMIDTPWIYTKYNSLEEFFDNRYVGYRIRSQREISEFLEELYSEGHHRYYTEEVEYGY